VGGGWSGGVTPTGRSPELVQAVGLMDDQLGRAALRIAARLWARDDKRMAYCRRICAHGGVAAALTAARTHPAAGREIFVALTEGQHRTCEAILATSPSPFDIVCLDEASRSAAIASYKRRELTSAAGRRWSPGPVS